MSVDSISAWFLTLVLHASLLLALAWVLVRALPHAQLGWREWIWRLALFGGLVSASAQVQMDHGHLVYLSGAPASAISVPVAAAVLAVDRTSTRAPAGGLHTAPSRNALATVAESGRQVSEPKPAAPSSEPPFGFAWAAQWTLLVLAVWMAGVGLGIVRLLRASGLLRRQLGRARPLAHAGLQKDAEVLREKAGLPALHIGVLDELPCPVAAGSDRILIPQWVFGRLDQARLRAMLAHEIAHLQRRDPFWKLAASLACVLLWFLPLAAMARHQLDAVAEQACDAWAAAQTGSGRELAECLAACVEYRLIGPRLELAAAMADRESPLMQRIDQLIEGKTMKLTVSRPRALAAIALTLAVAVSVLPGVGAGPARAQVEAPPPPPKPEAPATRVSAMSPRAPAAPTPPVSPSLPAPPDADSGRRNRYSSDQRGDRSLTTLEVEEAGHVWSARIQGAITFTDDYAAVASLGRGASASFAETVNGVSRKVEYANRNGQLAIRYFVNGEERLVDAAAKAWIASFVPEMIRETAIDAQRRVARIHARGGTPAVIAEIGRIRSDHARTVYISELVSITRLTPDQTTELLQLVDSFESDYARRNALTVLVSAGQLNPEQQKFVLTQALKFESDYERAELLRAILPGLSNAAELRKAWLRAALGIESGHEKRRCLSSLIDVAGDDAEILRAAVVAAGSIDSDYERRELLTDAIRSTSNAEWLADAYAVAVSGMQSSYERREALAALIHARGFGVRSAGAVLDSLPDMDSDYECREVLVVLADYMPNDADLIRRYREIARGLSDHERGEAERALDRFAT